MINSVQVVARELLAQYSKQHKKNPLLGMIQNWMATAGDKLRTRYILPKTSSPLLKGSTTVSRALTQVNLCLFDKFNIYVYKSSRDCKISTVCLPSNLRPKIWGGVSNLKQHVHSPMPHTSTD